MGKMEEEGYLKTDLDVVIRINVNDTLVDQNMDVYAKTFIVDGLPITGYYLIPVGHTLIDVEPIEIDMINNFIWTYNIERIYTDIDGFYKQQFKYTIFRNYKQFSTATFDDINTTERNLHSVLERLHTKRKNVDFRMKNYKERIVNNIYNVNSIIFEVLEYIDGENKIRIRSIKDSTESVMDAFIVNE